MSKTITGIVLCGGKSLRMGTDKGFILYQGQTLISYALNILKSNLALIKINSGNTEYQTLGYPVFSDLIPNLGPMGGVASALELCETNGCFFVPCDCPELKSELVANMLKLAQSADVVFLKTRSQKPQPLPIYIDCKILPIIKKLIDDQNYMMQSIVPTVLKMKAGKVVYILINEELKNINSPHDVS